jgi:hypothetical protein
MTQFQLGSISTGTLRTEDLLPAFADTLEDRGSTYESSPDMWDSIRKYRSLIDQNMLDMINLTSECVLAKLINETLFDALNELCPPFVYFGTHPGDGSDFGFWPDRDAIQEAIDPTSCLVRINANGDYVLEEDGVIVQVSDHGNVTVMDLERNVIWSVV